ncbi:molecular chaperone OsmY [Serratia sp. UGAL515B_01]|uniref:molecular chaperone OsmY n=1 Tax=Serratia sp. UGAL515B_01 TaxID=2986763 RepID=UPI0029540599|nr:molecular chaperone OsmY [Serratia sp. UGAL515B_01]WON77593.1 molecular chaperone OsmY [Serratia sp. UGAL515B_01]
MKNTKFAHSLVVIVLGSALLSGTAVAEETLLNKASSVADSAGAKIDSSIKTIGSSMKKVDSYMDDSAITAKVKSALVEDKSIKSNDISVITEGGVVTLTGFVTSQMQAEKAVKAASLVDGVKSVSDKLHVKDEETQSIKAYANDAATTSELKAKLLADDIVPSRNVKVETADGVVQLSGTVKTLEQSERAEKIAKAIEGVKSVKNDLAVKP